jgi:predicted O-linked N-acetylglucosamine transferase (SPINDLY family)
MPSAAEHYRRGNALQSANRFEEALQSYDQALAIDPGFADALCNRANVFRSLARPGQAVIDLEKAVALAPGHEVALPMLMEAEMHICKWDRMYERLPVLNEGIDSGRLRVSPLVLLMGVSDPARQFKGFQRYVRSLLRSDPSPRPRPWSHDRIRLAYLSSDFRPHAVSFLTAELFEKHDRERFEVIGISYGPDDAGDLRKRLVAAFDQFHDVRQEKDDDIARLMRRLEIDVAVDLTGLTALGRIGIFGRRPAAVQVGWLGYPATTGTDAIDYIVGDKVALPFALQPFFSEKIVHLPESYFLRDTTQAIPGASPDRVAAGLPPQGFVFCCFSQCYKFTPGVFDVWMRLLRQIDRSVLWLAMAHPPAIANLRREAAARGVDPARLVFAPQVDLPEHLARHRHADLFLDTVPYNALTTAMDALWTGVPVLTTLGRTFIGRGAASALNTIGLPELIMRNLGDYEALALQFARDPVRLTAIREKLLRNRARTPLFDTDRFRRHIEAAYLAMCEQSRRGEPPRSFVVPPSGS